LTPIVRTISKDSGWGKPIFIPKIRLGILYLAGIKGSACAGSAPGEAKITGEDVDV
jgi:hypothetical protein